MRSLRTILGLQLRLRDGPALASTKVIRLSEEIRFVYCKQLDVFIKHPPFLCHGFSCKKIFALTKVCK